MTKTIVVFIDAQMLKELGASDVEALEFLQTKEDDVRELLRAKLPGILETLLDEYLDELHEDPETESEALEFSTLTTADRQK